MATRPSEILQVISGEMQPEDSDIYQRFARLLSWADQHRRLGIRANALCPGVLEAVMADRKSGMTEHEIKKRNDRFIPMVPMQRLGRYEEIAKCILFLASDDASYVNGAQLVADGGLMA
jgi:NAD(P)-dependent dehydrogenase (short-subunit alcohol dehydrogenase family)